jgi:hypothetical protein
MFAPLLPVVIETLRTYASYNRDLTLISAVEGATVFVAGHNAERVKALTAGSPPTSEAQPVVLSA